jgi:hypothetical protein
MPRRCSIGRLGAASTRPAKTGAQEGTSDLPVGVDLARGHAPIDHQLQEHGSGCAGPEAPPPARRGARRRPGRPQEPGDGRVLQVDPVRLVEYGAELAGERLVRRQRRPQAPEGASSTCCCTAR